MPTHPTAHQPGSTATSVSRSLSVTRNVAVKEPPMLPTLPHSACSIPAGTEHLKPWGAAEVVMLQTPCCADQHHDNLGSIYKVGSTWIYTKLRRTMLQHELQAHPQQGHKLLSQGLSGSRYKTEIASTLFPVTTTRHVPAQSCRGYHFGSLQSSRCNSLTSCLPWQLHVQQHRGCCLQFWA